MNKIINSKYILIAILFIAAILRLWKLGSIPPGLTPDEAAIGYNAYSVLTTGRDEHGEFLPLIFRSFGDFKPGLEIYLTIPFIALFGLTEFAVRLPSAIAGVIAVFLIYLVVKQLVSYELVVKDVKVRTRNVLALNPLTRQLLPYVSAFLLAASPWHIHYSRGAWEIGIVFTLTLAGIYFFLKSLKIPKYLIPSSVFFALTLLTYQGAKLSSAIVVVVLILVFWQEFRLLIKNNLSLTVRSVFLALLIASPILLSLFQGKAGRLEVFSIFSYSRPTVQIQEILDQGNEKLGGGSYYLYHSEGLNYTRAILGRYFNHFSTRFLFFEGDWQNPRHSAPNHGMMLLADILLLGVGIYVLANIKGRYKYFIILWLLLAPLPAALTRDQVHAVRAFNMVIPLVMLSGLGLTYLLNRINSIKKAWQKTVGNIIAFTFLLLPFIYFLDSYFVHLPVHNAKHWFYGYREMVRTVTPLQPERDRIVVQQSYDQPYIYFLFYQKYPPAKYQSQIRFTTDNGVDVGLVESLDNITFQLTSWPVGGIDEGEVVVVDGITATKELVGDDWRIVKEITYPDNIQTAFWVLEKI